MALFDNFVFADPALQQAQAQEAIAEAQIRAAQQQARQAGLERVGREREARAIRQAEIDRAERAQQQQDRQFQQNLAQRDRELAANTDLYRTYQKESQLAADKKAADAAELESYNALLRQWSDPNLTDPPTALEAKALAEGINPARQARLFSVLDSTRNRRNQFAVDAELAKKKWDARITGLDPKKGETLEKVLADFDKSRDRDYLSYDPGAGFIPRFRRPRQDVPFGPQEAPVTGAAITGAAMTPDQFRASLGAAAVPPAFGAIQPFATRAVTGIMEAITNPQIPSATPTVPSVPSAASTFPTLSISDMMRQMQSAAEPAPRPVGPLAPVNMPFQGSALRFTNPPPAALSPVNMPYEGSAIRASMLGDGGVLGPLDYSGVDYSTAIARPNATAIPPPPQEPAYSPLSPVNMPFQGSAFRAEPPSLPEWYERIMRRYNPRMLGTNGVLAPLQY